jgi:hypothetical protein
MRFERIAASSTTMVASPNSGSMALSPDLSFSVVQRNLLLAIDQLK